MQTVMVSEKEEDRHTDRQINKQEGRKAEKYTRTEIQMEGDGQRGRQTGK